MWPNPRSTVCSIHRMRWRELAPLALIAIASVVLRAGIVSIPLERDEGEYAYVAARWLNGEIPYRDAFDQKPPGIFAAYWLLFACGLRSIEAIHWSGHVSLLASVAFLYGVGRRLFGQMAGCAAALAAVALVMDSSVLGNASNTELFAILPLAAGMYFSLRALELPGSAWWSGAAGLSGGLALCFKQVTLPVVLFYAAWIALATRRSGSQPGLRSMARGPADLDSGVRWWALAVHAAGVLIPPATAGVYFAAQGAWGAFFDCVVAHNLDYSARVPLRFYPALFWQNLRPIAAAQWPILACAAAGLFGSSRWASGLRVVLGWCLASLIALSVGGYFRQHYFILVLLPIALIAGCGIEAVAGRLAGGRAGRKSLIAAGLAIAAAAWPVALHRAYYFSASPELACRLLYGINPFPESITVGRHIRDRTRADERVFVYGSEPQILFYADRRSASRYIFMYPLYGGAPDAAARQREVIAELHRNAPRFIVAVTGHVPRSFSADPDAPHELRMHIEELLARHYQRVAVAWARPGGGHRLIPDTRRPEDDAELSATSDGEGIPTLEVWERRADP